MLSSLLLFAIGFCAGVTVGLWLARALHRPYLPATKGIIRFGTPIPR